MGTVVLVRVRRAGVGDCPKCGGQLFPSDFAGEAASCLQCGLIRWRSEPMGLSKEVKRKSKVYDCWRKES